MTATHPTSSSGRPAGATGTTGRPAPVRPDDRPRAERPRARRPRARRPALVAVAHGSRDPRAEETVRALLDLVRVLRPGLPVHLGHIELNAPLLPGTLAGLDARGTGSAVLVPLLLGHGHHVKRDIPELAATARLHTRVAAPLGPHPLLVDTLYARLAEAGWNPHATAAERRTSAVVLAAAGSRDPGSRLGTARTAALLADRLGVPVLPAYASAAAPTVPRAVAALRSQGRTRIALASCFTAPGRFATECAAAAPWITAAPLGAHEKMARLVLHRYDEALIAAARTAGEPRPAPA